MKGDGSWKAGVGGEIIREGGVVQDDLGGDETVREEVWAAS